ncbi:hypothetical protein XELAEV_18035172mg [Xenopus laevis]|uniref:Uncharacterized protein n=1 Tax=Xenopus laevis TaxID=8355 RepID=A0A974CGC2_XENLA|nr:hypothetical protein XELAEV_18035172mg [Xenopus laevis]
MGLFSSKDHLYIKGYRQGSQWIYRKEERICKITDLESMRKDIIGEIKWTSYDYCIARDSLELTRWWKIRFMAEVLQDNMKAKARLKSLYKQLEEINWAIFRKYMETYPAVPHLHLKYGSIYKSTLKPLGRPCIPFHSIAQTAEAGSAGCLGSNGMERNAVFTL